LGVTGAIRSPTYTLVERYPIAMGEGRDGTPSQAAAEALHLDLYRIGSGAELEFLGLDDVPAALWLVEWPERGEGGLPAADLHIVLALHADGRAGRACRLEAVSAAGRAWLQRLADVAPAPG
jgi:tRNA threonylcarbamoyladenosine biosynthesis protein TsaE